MFIYLLSFIMPDLVKYLFMSSGYFVIRWFSYYTVLRVLCIFWIIVHQMCLFRFFPSLGLSSHSFDIVIHRVEAFSFNKVQLINSFFKNIILFLLYLKSHHHVKGHGSCLLYYLLGGFQFCVLYLVRWYIFCQFLWRMKGLYLYSFFAYARPVVPEPFIKETGFALFCYLLVVKDQLIIFMQAYFWTIIFHWSVCLIFQWYYSILTTVAVQ